MKKIIIVIIFVCFAVGAAAFGYKFIRNKTSDEAVENRILSFMEALGEVEIGHAHLDFLEGIIIDDLSFKGTFGELRNKTFNFPRIIVKHEPQSLFKGQFKLTNVVLVEPEITIEKPSSIWLLLNALKANIEKADLPVFWDLLRNGIEMRDAKVHIHENPTINIPEIKLSGVNAVLQPYAGTFKNITIKGNIDDEFFGNYSFSMRLRPGIPRLDIEANANNIVLNREFLTHVPFYGKEIWENYQPGGKVNLSCSVSLDNQNNQKKIDYDLNVRLSQLRAVYKDLPLPVYDLNGTIKFNSGKLYLKDLVGYIKSGDVVSQVILKGVFDLLQSQKSFTLTIPNLFVDEELLKKVPKYGELVWGKLRPNGLVKASYQSNTGENQKQNYFLSVMCKDVKITPPDFPLPISHLNGQFNLYNNILLLKNTSGIIQDENQSVFAEINGVYNIQNGRKFIKVRAPNIQITESLVNNLPNKEKYQRLWTEMNPQGKIDLNVVVQGFSHESKDEFSIEVEMKDCEVTNRKYKFPLWGINGRLEINNEKIVCRHFDATSCGGHIGGTFLVKTSTKPYQYEGEISFSRIMMEELVQKVTDLEKPWTGILSGRIKYHGNSNDLDSLKAEGQLNVNQGYLADVPIVLNIFNFLNLSLPKKESFHSAKVEFTIKDGIIHVESGKMYSDTIELTGRGTVHLDGAIHLTIVTGFNKDFFSQLPIVGKLFDFVVGGVRKQLTIVEIRGTFLNPETHPVPFKPFTRSIKSMFDVLPEGEQEKVQEKVQEKKQGKNNDVDIHEEKWH